VNYTVVGLFVLVLGTALIAVVLWLASGGAVQKRYTLYQAISEESVSGLSESAPVKYNGVDVGKVKQIALDPVNPQRVILLFAIERGTPIKTDTVAKLKSQGLTGIAHVELSGGSREAPLLQASAGAPYPVIPTTPSLAARLENILTNLAAKLDTTSSSIAAFLSEENQVAFKSALADIAAVSKTISGRKEALDAGIASAARTFENTARVTAQVEPLIARIERSAGAVEKMGDEVAKTSASAGKTIDTVGADVKRFTAESLPEFQRLLDEMTVLATSLRRLSEKIEGSPGGLLLGRRPVPPGPGETAAAK
jgi:phospholipid/cholesterol/gamma-HCH transport system substrate-binding protein